MEHVKPPEYNFSSSSFPIQIEAFRQDNKEVVWSKTLELPEPGTKHKLEVPALKKIHGCAVGIRVKYADDPEWKETLYQPN